MHPWTMANPRQRQLLSRVYFCFFSLPGLIPGRTVEPKLIPDSSKHSHAQPRTRRKRSDPPFAKPPESLALETCGHPSRAFLGCEASAVQWRTNRTRLRPSHAGWAMSEKKEEPVWAGTREGEGSAARWWARISVPFLRDRSETAAPARTPETVA